MSMAPATQICLDIPEGRAAAAATLLRATPVAAVLLRGATDKPAIAALQATGAAVMLDTSAEEVRRLGADGLHCTGAEQAASACRALRPAVMVGASGLVSRHDAMVAGEAGADYVLFGEPDAAGARPALPAVLERLAWWQEIFQVPCVGYAAAPSDIAPLAQAGADFVMLGPWLFDDVATAPRHLAEIVAASRTASGAAS